MSSPRAMTLYYKSLAFGVSGDTLVRELTKSTELFRCPINDPIYFVYHQAVELALKACLLTTGSRPGNTHHISDLFERCRTANPLAGLGSGCQEYKA
jgi:HEPN domain